MGISRPCCLFIFLGPTSIAIDLNSFGGGCRGGRVEGSPARQAFCVFDRNGDGMITQDEVKEVLRAKELEEPPRPPY